MLEQGRREATAKDAASADKGAGAPPFAVSGPSLSLPKGGGAIRGIGEKFAANPVTGTASLSIPIETSPARSGFGPQLVLNYDSSAGNTVFGFGWDLSLPRITRKTDKGLPRYLDAEESDVFILSGAEDLVPVYRKDAAGDWIGDARGRHVAEQIERDGHMVRRYRPRIEGQFARIERWTRIADGDVHWRSFTRDNVVTLYGRTGDSRIADPEDAGRVFSWLACESYDDRGNAIVHEYVSEDARALDLSQAHERNRTDRQRAANRYLKRILYGNRTPNRDADWLATSAAVLDDWMFEVVFDYGEPHYEVLPAAAGQHQFVRATEATDSAWAMRPDPYSSYRAGFEVRSYRRCRRVLMFHRFPELGAEPCLVRSTEFDYADLAIGPATTVDAELAHLGSTRFASFIQAATQSGYRRDTSQPVQVINGSEYVTYLRKSLPPLEFGYTKAVIDDAVRDVDPGSLENLPFGVDGTAYQWADLDGEGLPGILSEQANAWFYKRNLSAAHRVTEEGIERTTPHFSPVELVAEKPNSDLSGGALLDLAGDGSLDLVAFSGPAPGFYERNAEQGWAPFKPFALLPNVAWNDANLRFVDLDGDGHADVLITQDEVFTWHASLAEAGFDTASRVAMPPNEEAGPRLVFADGTFSVYLADMSGDGLTDLVRVRNGEVCYWPSLGYGRFGAKVALDNAPRFDTAEQFDQRRIRIADIDGSGCSDLVYLGADGVRIYFNQCGNRLSDARRLAQFPAIEDVSSVLATDLLGNGTACLVWSSPLPANASRPMRYIDLMGGQKPHLLARVENNLGAETRVQYAPSTRFYLADKLAGKPWITRLPFPVQLVERVDTYDRISRNRFVTRYAYHHGYFDGVEREFRGFGMVEQWDTEEFAALADNQAFPVAANIDESSHVPPVLTRTWFHTGVYLGRDRVSNFFAGLLSGSDQGEYYREPGLNDTQARQRLLDDSTLPDNLSVEEEREACRALKGSMLRQEVYAQDGTEQARHPYTVIEQNFTVCCLQPQGGNRHAVFFSHAREVLSYHYERNPADPRIAHALTLEVDQFGNLLKTIAVGYGRRQPDMTLEARDRDKQGALLITYTENDVTNRIDSADDYRVPLECASRMYALTGMALSIGNNRLTFAEALNAGAAAVLIPYEQTPTPGIQQKRLIEHVRTLYRRNDLTGPLPLGELQSMALLFEGYKLAFTAGLLAQVYGGRASDAMLENDGRYLHSEGDADWWTPSGRMFYSPDTTDLPPQELAWARQHFFLPHRFRNPFHTDPAPTETIVGYDDHRLLLQETRDALGNRVTAGERNIDPAQPLVRQGQDYRVLQPVLIMDPNRNCSAFAFDALGMLAGTAVMGKPEDNPRRGDVLDGFIPDQTDAAIAAHLQAPLTDPHALLQRATTCVVYDRSAYYRSKAQADPQPATVYALARETHDADLAAGQLTRIQHSFSCSDGFGRDIQKKIQAEPGPVPKRDAAGRIITIDGQPQMTPNDVSPRWVGSGWTVFNNKGKPVRQYEPFFTDTHRFEFEVRIGVSPVLFYDPVERVVATLHPNHTWEKHIFTPWRQETWDANDTVLVPDPKADADVGDFFARLPDAAYLPSWHAQRQGGALGAQEQAAARKTAVHAATPTAAHADSLARTFLTIAHNRFKYSDTPPADPPSETFHPTRVVFDIEGNQRDIIDARDRVVMHYDYDMLGNRIHQSSMDAGERWILNDVLGKTLTIWNSRGHQLRTVYDRLRRPTAELLRESAGGMTLTVEQTLYGETQPNPEANNLRGRVARLFDQAGIVSSDEYDFKGNLLRNQRQLAQAYSATLDWSAAVLLEADSYTNRTRYDALNRPIELTAPDNTLIRPGYNEANLLDSVDANLHGAQQNGQAVWTPFVTDIDYDAKGQRMLIAYGNGVTTSYAYDPLTFRLLHLVSRRNAAAFPDDCPQPPPAGWPGCQVQSLHYTYDPMGNVTELSDDAQQTRYFHNKRVEPGAEYTYDALYQLIEATGREHLGQIAAAPAPGSYNDKPRTGILLSASDGNAVGRYLQRYVYDLVGNVAQMMHRGSDPIHPGWTRSYAYDEPSLLEPAKQSNRLTSTTIGATTETYSSGGNGYDVHGNLLRMPQLQAMQWDFKDQLQMTRRQAVNAADDDGVQRQGERSWYVYGAGGQRVRKVTELATGQIKDERIYVGDFEVYRRHGAAPLVRETLHIVDDKQRIALVETRTQGNEPGVPVQLSRYQFRNHLGSTSLELDEAAQIISYEEYTPYGSTSYQAVRSQTETPKRYRYTGKERDEESGLYYHGARYYAPWLARWTSADPRGIEDGVNVYVYAGGNPTRFIDPDGREIVISYKEGTETKTLTYSYQKDRKVDEKASQFLKNTLKSLDYLVEKKATNITIGEGKDAKTVDILDALIKDKKNKVTITEGAAASGNVYTPATNTVQFLHDQAAKFRKDSSKPWSADNTGRTSPAGLLAHELIHAYNDIFDSENYKKRRKDTSSKTEDKFSFPNKEEEYVTKDLANKVLNNLGEDNRQNYGKNYYTVDDPTSTKAQTAAPKPAEEKKPAEQKKPEPAKPPAKPPEKKGAMNLPGSRGPSPTLWSGLDLRFSRAGAI